MTAKPKNTKKPEKDDLTRPGKFSLEALLAGRTNPVESRFVTVDPDPAARVGKLRTEKLGLEEALSLAAAEPGPERRMAAKDDRRERIREIDAEIKELTEALDGTWLEVQFRPLTVLEQDDTQDAQLSGQAATSAFMWSKCAQLRPAGSESEEDWQNLSVKEWHKLIDAIGIPQFRELDKVLGSLTYGRSVTPDFFGLPSVSRTTNSS